MSAAESLAIDRRRMESFRRRLVVGAVVVFDCTGDCAVVVVADGADDFAAVVVAAVAVGDAGCDVVVAVAVVRCRLELKLRVRIRATVDQASTSV